METVPKWDGVTERRKHKPPLEGRRQSDVRCSDHILLWGHHDKDTAEHRELVCKKLEAVQKNIASEILRLEKDTDALKAVDVNMDEKIEKVEEKMVGKYWFHRTVLFLLLLIGITGLGNYWGLNHIITKLDSTIVAVNNNLVERQKITGRVDSIEGEIGTLKERQKVLRDASIEHLTKEHPTKK